MRYSTITNYFKAIKQEPVVEAEAFNFNTSLECTSTAIKNEQQCYIKEEIDIPDYISNTSDSNADSDCDSLCTKPCTDLVNRTCLVVISRLSDAVLQKYLANENQSEKIIGEPDNLYKDNVENCATKNQQTDIIKNNGRSNLRKRKRSDAEITQFYTSMNKENIENLDANSEQKEIFEDNSGGKVKKCRNNDLEVTEYCTSPSKQTKQTTHMDNKQREIIKNNSLKKVRNNKKSDITKFFTSLNTETSPLLNNSTFENPDTNNRQSKIIESNDKKDAEGQHIRSSKRNGAFTTEFYRSFCPKCKKTFKTRKEIKQCCNCKIRLMYECKKCHKQLGSHNGMANHVRTLCIKQGYYYECFKCEFRSPLRSYVTRHLRRVHTNSFFPERIKKIASKEIQVDVAPKIDECTKCGQQFSALHKLMRHIQLCDGSEDSKEHTSDYAASKDKILRYCSKCNETIKDIGTDKKLCNKCQIVLAVKCSICEKLFTSCSGAINHIVKNHIEKEWKCCKCDFKTGSMTSLTTHYARMHNPKVFECTKCGMTRKSREHLTKHLRKCGVKPNLHCAHCSYKTCLRIHLRLHIHSVHFREDKSVACPKCQKICKNDTVLKTHLKTTCEKEANLQCEHCSFTTKFKCSLMKHILRHHSTGTKYECSKCKDQFKNNARLKNHLLVCGIDRSLQCKMCSYKTSKEQYLGWHVRNMHKNDDGIIS